MPKVGQGKIAYVGLGGRRGKVRASSGAYVEFIADDPVSYGDQVQYELGEDGKAKVRQRTKIAMR